MAESFVNFLMIMDLQLWWQKTMSVKKQRGKQQKFCSRWYKSSSRKEKPVKQQNQHSKIC